MANIADYFKAHLATPDLGAVPAVQRRRMARRHALANSPR